MEVLVDKLLRGTALNTAVLGKSARLDAMAWSLANSKRSGLCSILSDVVNRSLRAKGSVRQGYSDREKDVLSFAAEFRPDFAVIGPEEPLAEGAVNWLQSVGIPCVGPTKELAQLESSKAFTRRLIAKYKPDANPEHQIFHSLDGVAQYLRKLGDYAIKPDGLTGGKGVRVSGDHILSVDEGVEYARELLSKDSEIIIEEKLCGEEFSLQSFCDGKTLRHMPPVQDHKRALPGDRGPNTGGMGSYSCGDHSLPFLTTDELSAAKQINECVARALAQDLNQEYKGIIYGSFMATPNGIKVVEYNARFGDPECMNVLSIMETDFIDICVAMLSGTLDNVNVKFLPKATVCKYVVPDGYPSSCVGDAEIWVPASLEESNELRIFYGAVDDEKDGKLRLTGSRAIAFVGVADTLSEAEQIAEAAASQVRGPVSHRKDIGTAELVNARVARMESVRREGFPMLRRA